MEIFTIITGYAGIALIQAQNQENRLKDKPTRTLEVKTTILAVWLLVKVFH